MSDAIAPRPERGGPTVSSPLPAATTGALRDWLLSQGSTHARAVGSRPLELCEAELRDAMRWLCAEARRWELRVEQVIVLLKQLWAALPRDLERRARPHERRALLDGIVRVCIEEFYAGAAGVGPVDGRSSDGASRDGSAVEASPPGAPPCSVLAGPAGTPLARPAPSAAPRRRRRPAWAARASRARQEES